MSDVLVTYDINTTTKKGQRRLREVAKICEGFGLRVQYSVFECRIDRPALERLVGLLADAIDPLQDSVRLYRFDADMTLARTCLGTNRRLDVGSNWVF